MASLNDLERAFYLQQLAATSPATSLPDLRSAYYGAVLGSNVIPVWSGQSVQDAVDAAYVRSGGSWDNIQFVNVLPGAINDVLRDVSYRLYTSDSVEADGVVILQDLEMELPYEAPYFDVPMVAVKIDDGVNANIKKAAGLSFLPDYTDLGSAGKYIHDNGAVAGSLSGQAMTNVITGYNEDLANEDAPPDAWAPVAATRMACYANNGEVTGVIGCIGKGQIVAPISLAGITHVAFYFRSGIALTKGQIQVSFSAHAFFGAAGSEFNPADAVWIDIPAMPANTWRHVCVDISGLGDIATIRGITQAKSFAIKLNTVNLGASGAIYLTDIRVATHQFIGVSPVTYAARKGIPITHAVIADNIGTSGNMAAADLWKQCVCRGASIVAHPTILTADQMDRSVFLGKLLGYRQRLSYLYASTYMTTNGIPCRGYVQSGASDSEPTAQANMYDEYATEIRRWFEYGFFGTNMGSRNVRSKFGTAYAFSMTTALADLVTTNGSNVAPTQNMIITEHTVAEAADGTHCTYAAWKAVIDQLSGWQLGGKIVCVSMDSFYFAIQPTLFGTHTAPLARVPSYINVVSNMSTSAPYTTSSDGLASVIQISEYPQGTSTNLVGLPLIPGRQLCFMCSVVSDGAADGGRVIISPRFYKWDETHAKTGVPVLCDTTMIGTDKVYLHGQVTIPDWAWKLEIDITCYPDAAAKLAIDDIMYAVK